jgi:hypothetical protein
VDTGENQSVSRLIFDEKSLGALSTIAGKRFDSRARGSCALPLATVGDTVTDDHRWR